MKKVLLIDAFIFDEEQKNKLSNFIDRVKKNGDDIFLISNTPLDKEIQRKVNLFFYDESNRLFKYDYSEYEYFILWRIAGNFRLHTYHEHRQKHGLSVLVNLFNSLNVCKHLGYTHFHRIEYDMEIGDQTLDFIKEIPEKCKDKKGYFYVNHKNSTQIFQYFFSEIEFFLDRFKNISSEDEYLSYLDSEFGSLKFWTVEDLMYYQMQKFSDEIFIVDNIFSELQDSIWNTSTSRAHLEEYQKTYNTEVYKIKKDGAETGNFLVFTKKESDESMTRDVKISYPDGSYKMIENNISVKGGWEYTIIENTPQRIEIFNDGSLVLDLDPSNINNYADTIA